MTNTNKARKTNRKVIATLCAVTAAMAIVTGITVCSASAISKNKTNPKTAAASQTVTTTVSDSSNSARVTTVTNNQNAVQTQAAPQAAAQNANGYNYTYDNNAANENAAQQQAPAAQQTTAGAQQTTAAATGDGSLYIPEGEVNDWKIHNAKDGFPIGSYVCGQKILNVVKLDNANYDITVTEPVGENGGVVYSIKAVANGSKMYYTNATKSNVTYDENRNIIDAQIIDSNHQGTFDASDAGYTWVDTEGTTIFVPWMEF